MGKKKDIYPEYVKPLEGQLSVWDVLERITESDTKTPENKILEKAYVPIINYYNESQEKCIKKYEKIPGLNRIIKYSFGAIGVELKEGDLYKTIYINNNGIEEFSIQDKSSVLPNDKIIFYNKNSEFNTNSIQEERLKEVQEKAEEVIRRKGDENIIVQLKDKTLSINKKGWVLEFLKTKIEEEVDKNIKKSSKEGSNDEISIGDVIRFQYDKDEVLEGKVTHIYGQSKESLCVGFSKGNTAIWKGLVKEIISKA